MLPSTGYFKTISCPFYDSGLCERPYCHFRHVKSETVDTQQQLTENADEGRNVNSQGAESPDGLLADGNLSKLVSEAVKRILQHKEIISGSPSISGAAVSEKIVTQVVEELKPTISHNTKLMSLSEPPMLRSHRAYLPPAGIPQYKPTPISELKKRHSPVPYTPLPTPRGSSKVQAKRSDQSDDLSIKKRTKNDIVIGSYDDVREPQRSSKAPAYNPRAVELSSHNGWSDSSKPSYVPSSINILPPENSDYVPSPVVLATQLQEVPEYCPSDQSSSKPNYIREASVASQSNVKYTPTLRSEWDDDTDNLDLTREVNMLEKILNENSKESDKPFEGKSARESESAQSSAFKSEASADHDQIEDDSVESKTTSVTAVQKTVKGKRSEKSVSKAHSNEKDKGDKRHSRTERRKSSTGGSSTGKEKTEKKDNNRKKESSKKENRSKQESRNKKESRNSSDSKHNREKSKHGSRKRNVSRSETTSKEKLSHSSSSHHGEKRHSSSSGRSNDNHHKRSRHNSGKHSNGSSRSSKKDFEETTNKGTDDKCSRTPEEESESETMSERLSLSPTEAHLFLSDDEDTITEECYRIFKEYEPQHTAPKTTVKEAEPVKEEEPQGKRRIAHEGALYHPPKIVSVRMLRPNPVQVMQARFAKIKELQEKKLENPGTVMSRSFPGTSDSGSTNPPNRVRIARVPNVTMLLNEKNRVQELVRKKQSAAKEKKEMEEKSVSSLPVGKNPGESRTVAQSVPKGALRVAHKPSTIPVSQPRVSAGGKIPTHVRQRYLDILAAEFSKIHSLAQANSKALEEESEIFERSTTRLTYSSNMSNLIGRVRREVNPAVGDAESCPAGSRVMSHSAILRGPSKSKGLWSVVRKPLIQTENFFCQLQKYLLTEEQLITNGYPRPHPYDKSGAIVQQTLYSKRECLSATERKIRRVCARCGRSYNINKDGFQISEESCVYHWGRIYKQEAKGTFDQKYSCCDGTGYSEGCTVWSNHVSDDYDPNNLRGFVKTLPAEKEPPNSDYGIYSLDCEMCYTTEGLELARVSVVDRDLNTVYESLVKPANSIIDYNTRFSGITEEHMEGVETSIYNVQASLLSMIHDRTILIGHSLESDLKTLKIIHNTVVDTSIVFPHKNGPPKKKALRTLCREFLNKIIQESESGHDSAEDAKACMELMKFKVRQAI